MNKKMIIVSVMVLISASIAFFITNRSIKLREVEATVACKIYKPPTPYVGLGKENGKVTAKNLLTVEENIVELIYKAERYKVDDRKLYDTVKVGDKVKVLIDNSNNVVTVMEGK